MLPGVLSSEHLLITRRLLLDAKKSRRESRTFFYTLSPLTACVSLQHVLSKMAQGDQQEEGKEMMLKNECPSVALIL